MLWVWVSVTIAIGLLSAAYLVMPKSVQELVAKHRASHCRGCRLVNEIRTFLFARNVANSTKDEYLRHVAEDVCEAVMESLVSSTFGRYTALAQTKYEKVWSELHALLYELDTPETLLSQVQQWTTSS